MGKLTNAILKNKAAGGTAPAAESQQESKLRSAILQAKNPVKEQEEKKVNSPAANSGLSRDEYDSAVRNGYRERLEAEQTPKGANTAPIWQQPKQATQQEADPRPGANFSIPGSVTVKDLLKQRNAAAENSKTPAGKQTNRELAVNDFGAATESRVRAGSFGGSSSGSTRAREGFTGERKHPTQMRSRIGKTIEGSTEDYFGALVSALGVGMETANAKNPANQAVQIIEQMQGENASPVVKGAADLEKERNTAAKQNAELIRKAGSELSAKGQAQMQQAKVGQSAGAQAALDLVGVGTQMVLDIGIGALTKMGMMAPMAARVFGSSAEKAAAEGANLEQQVTYGLASAGVAYALEKISNVAFAGLKIVNPGITDDVVKKAIDKLAQKLASGPKGATVLKAVASLATAAGGEGLEEFLEALIDPYLQRMTYDKDAKSIFQDPELMSEALYSAFLGGVLGGIGGNVNLSINTILETGANEDLREAYRQYLSFYTDEAVNEAYAAMKENGMFSNEAAEAMKKTDQKLQRMMPKTEQRAAQNRAGITVAAQVDEKGENKAAGAVEGAGNTETHPTQETAQSGKISEAETGVRANAQTRAENLRAAERIIAAKDEKAMADIIMQGVNAGRNTEAHRHAAEIAEKIAGRKLPTAEELSVQMELNAAESVKMDGQTEQPAVNWEKYPNLQKMMNGDPGVDRGKLASETRAALQNGDLTLDDGTAVKEETAPAATEAAEAVSTEPAPVMAGQEGAEYAGEDRVSGDRGRRAGAAAGEPGRPVAQGTGRRQNREVQNIRGRSRADDVSFAYEHAGAEPVSTRDLYGDERGSEEADLREAPRSVIESDEELRGLAGEIRQAGYEPHFFTGMARLKSGQPCPAYFDGKRVFVRIDHPKWTATELWDHEKFHGIKDKDPGIVDRIWTQLAKTTDREQLQNTLKVYRDRYHGAYDVDAEGDTVWNVDVMQKIVEEILADAYAGRDAFGTGVEDYTETVREMAGQIEEATAEARGPPEGRFAEDADSDAVDEDADERTYLELENERYKLNQRERQLSEMKKTALESESLVSAMDEYSAMFSEMRELLPKRRTGAATQSELDRIEELKVLREKKMKEIQDLQKELGLEDISREESEIREKKEQLRKASDRAWEREGAAKENAAIEKAGVSAEEYFRKKALKKFGTTRNFNEAGYLLPDGKMLDFSGGERNHRYRDHREIGEVYEATNGVKALNRFLSDGNIRIMAESPGIDLTEGVEPTREQYEMLRKFINTNGAKDGRFYVDFSAKDGHRVGNYSYENRVNADRILNDIKYFYQKGETRPMSETEQFRFAVDAAEETPAQRLRNEAEQYMPEGVTDRYRKEGSREQPEQKPWWEGEDEEIRKAAEMMAERNRRDPAFDVDEYLQRKRQEAEAERARRLRNVPKTEFEGTEAMNKLGIRVEGSVANYAAADQIRKRHSAARSIQKELRKAEKRLGATGTEQKYAKDIAGGVLTEEMLPTGVRQDVVMELADYYLAERAQGIDMIRQKRMEINQTLDEQMANLFKDTDKYDPSPIIVLNNRTPQRNMLKIFGDKLGQKINELIFDPVATNEAERIRFINRQLDQVRTFADSTGKQSRLNKDERALVQMMIEGRAVEEIVAGMEMGGAIQRLGKSIAEGADNGDGPQAVGLNGKERDLAKKYARWLQAQEALQSDSVDSVKVANAADKYSQLFDQYYDAINDFLVVHGYEPIGFIKGYAPHLQPEDNMDLLDKALKAIGVQRDIGNLPADIAGRTSEFKPNKRWNPYFLSRTGDETKYDIAEAFESYVDHLSDVLYHTDDIMRLRRMELFFRKNYSKTELGEKIDWAQHLREMKPEERLNALQDAGLVDTTTRLSPEDMAKVIEEYVEKNFAQMEDVTKYGEFVVWLQNYANILAGKQNMVDRAAEAGVGRKILGKLNRWLGLFAKSQVAGNISSALNQTSQLPMILAENGTRNTLRAARDMMKGDLRRAFADESDVLTGKAGIKFLVQTPGEMILDTMFTPAQWMDSMISSLAVRGAYLKAVKSGMSHEEAMKAADRYGRNVMGSREKGVKPIGFNEKNPLSKLLRVFQLEALNNWEHVSQDLPRDFRQIAEEHGKKKAAAALAGVIIKTLLSAFLLNRLTEETYGGTPAPFDFLGMSSNFIASGRGLSTNEWLMKVIDDGMEQLTGERSLGTEQMDRSEFDTEAAFADLGYNISNEIPFFGNVSALLGWGDKTLPWPHLRETGKELIEAVSEDGFLSGSTAQAAAGVAGEFLPGGRQMVKTIGGIQSAVRGGKATGYGDDMALQFPTEQSPGNIARQVLFGVNATPEARNYWASGNSKLSTKQTQLWKRLKDGGADSEDVYDTIHAWREVTANKELDSLTKSALQRNMVRHMDMTDDQKLDMYRTLSGADSRCDKFQRMMDAGMTFDQVMDAYERHEELDNDESLKASDKAAQFVQWAYMELDQEAANAAITELAFYTTMKAAPSQAALEEQLNQTSLTKAQKAAIWDSYGWKKMSPWG